MVSPKPSLFHAEQVSLSLSSMKPRRCLLEIWAGGEPGATYRLLYFCGVDPLLLAELYCCCTLSGSILLSRTSLKHKCMVSYLFAESGVSGLTMKFTSPEDIKCLICFSQL